MLGDFKADFGTYCFSNNHAWLCAPYFKLIEVGAMYKAGPEKLSQEQEDYVRLSLGGLGMDVAGIKELIG